MLVGENKNLKEYKRNRKKYGFPENVCFSNFAECPMTINGINLRHDEDYLLLCWCKATSKPLKFIKTQSLRVDQSPPPLLSQASWMRTSRGPGTSFKSSLKVILTTQPKSQKVDFEASPVPGSITFFMLDVNLWLSRCVTFFCSLYLPPLHLPFHSLTTYYATDKCSNRVQLLN